MTVLWNDTTEQDHTARGHPLVVLPLGAATLHESNRMEREQIDRHQFIFDLCVAARDISGDLIPPTAVPRETYFSDEHLWRLEVGAVCDLVHEYYGGVLVCIAHQLYFPAAALARCVHEVCFQFKYLAEHEEELRDWEEWQLAQDYHLLKTFLEHDLGLLRPDSAREMEHIVRKKTADIEHILGGPPPSRRHPWRTTNQIFDNLSDVKTLPDERGRGFRRHTIGFFSEYTHPRRFPVPPESLTLISASFSVLLTLRRAMELCRKKELLAAEADTHAAHIMKECERLMEDTD